MKGKFYKKAVSIILVVTMILTKTALHSVLAAEIGWREDTAGWWYQNADGSYQKNGWFQDIDKNWYYFNTKGYMQTGWIWDQGSWYFSDESGKMKTGVLEIDGQVYYFNPVVGDNFGKMQTGKVTIQDMVYYFNANGTAIGDFPTVEHRYQLSVPDHTMQSSENLIEQDTKVTDFNKDQIVLFKSSTMEGLIRNLLKEESNRNLTWNDLKGYTNVSFSILIDSRSKLVFQVGLGTTKEEIGKFQVGLEELESVIEDLSKFPDLREVEIKQIYMKYSIDSAGIGQEYEENMEDTIMLIDILLKHLKFCDLATQMDLKLKIKD